MKYEELKVKIDALGSLLTDLEERRREIGVE